MILLTELDCTQQGIFDYNSAQVCTACLTPHSLHNTRSTEAHSTWAILRIKNKRKVFPSVSSSLKCVWVGDWRVGFVGGGRRWHCTVYSIWARRFTFYLDNFSYWTKWEFYKRRYRPRLCASFVYALCFTFSLLINFLLGFLECVREMVPKAATLSLSVGFFVLLFLFCGGGRRRLHQFCVKKYTDINTLCGFLIAVVFAACCFFFVDATDECYFTRLALKKITTSYIWPLHLQ